MSRILSGGITIFGSLVIIFYLVMIGSWIGNAVKLTKCDFEPSYKGEVVHAIGLIPVASIITVWNDDK